MIKEQRTEIKQEIQVFLKKYPDSSNKEIKAFIMEGENPPDLINVSIRAFNKFIAETAKKFRETGGCLHHRGGNGRKVTATTNTNTEKVKQKMVKVPGASLRKVSKALKISYGSVSNILHKKIGVKAYHKYRVQKMSKEHKAKRIAFAHYWLKNYGDAVTQYSILSRLVNSDFSAYIRISGTHNSKNNVIWSKSRENGGELLEMTQEKFSQGEMIFGAITMRGLVPKNAPIFVSDLKKSYQPCPKTVNSQMYADMIKNKIAPAVKRLYPRNNAVWQDDGATIHRTQLALQTVEQNFSARVPIEHQAPKMADIWPIENVWSIIKQDLNGKDLQNVEELRVAIRSSWRRISGDKALCARLISSIPKRLRAVISKKGNQVFKEDY